MTAPEPLEPETASAPRIDPGSPRGRELARAFGELFDDIADRLRSEGKPVPDCLL